MTHPRPRPPQTPPTPTGPTPTGPAGTPAPGPARVAVVDDDTVLREGLAPLLPGIDLVAAARSVPQLLALVPDPAAVDVVLLDLNLAGAAAPGVPQGRRAVQAVTAAGFTVLIYTNERRRAVLAGCYLAGARGIVHKTEPLPRLQTGIDTVRAGGVIVTPAVAGLLDTIAAAGHLRALTDRQAEVLHGRARGETYPAIARRLHISPKTAEEYMAAVITKLATLVDSRVPAEIERQLGLAPGDLME